MGVRGILRDIAGIYLGIEIMKGLITESFVINKYVVISGLILLIFGIWFILERFGILPKMG